MYCVHQVATKENKALLARHGSLLVKGPAILNMTCKVLGLYLVCDLLDHLPLARSHVGTKRIPRNPVFSIQSRVICRKEHSESAWPIFMPKIFESIHDEDADARTHTAPPLPPV